MEIRKTKFKTGQIIKGNTLKGCTLCKILSGTMIMRKFQYQIGMNVDTKPFDLSGECEYGLHFSLVQDVLYDLDYGTQLAVISIPDDEDVYVENLEFRSHRLILERVMPLREVSTWKYLLENGVDIKTDNNCAIRFASERGYIDLVKFLHENGADITAYDNYAVRYAAERGHFDVVKYLYENGADITTKNNYAFRLSATNGHMKVAKYLKKRMK